MSAQQVIVMLYNNPKSDHAEKGAVVRDFDC